MLFLIYLLILKVIATFETHYEIECFLVCKVDLDTVLQNIPGVTPQETSRRTSFTFKTADVPKTPLPAKNAPLVQLKELARNFLVHQKQLSVYFDCCELTEEQSASVMESSEQSPDTQPKQTLVARATNITCVKQCSTLVHQQKVLLAGLIQSLLLNMTSNNFTGSVEVVKVTEILPKPDLSLLETLDVEGADNSWRVTKMAKGAFSGVKSAYDDPVGAAKSAGGWAAQGAWTGVKSVGGWAWGKIWGEGKEDSGTVGPQPDSSQSTTQVEAAPSSTETATTDR